MKHVQNENLSKGPRNREILHLQTNNQYHAIVPKYLYRFVILIRFHFAHASLNTTVDSKVINLKNRINRNINHSLLFI